MEHKNNYSAIVFFDNGDTKKWEYVHKLDEFAAKFLNNKHSSWRYMNVYERRTRTFLKQIKNGDQIPTFL